LPNFDEIEIGGKKEVMNRKNSNKKKAIIKEGGDKALSFIKRTYTKKNTRAR
jgi:hypothetical protein